MEGKVQFENLRLFEARLDAKVSARTRSRIGDRIGTFLAKEMLVNAQRQDIFMLGKTQSSITHQQTNAGQRTTIEAGVAGVPYARWIEFGTTNERGTSPGLILRRIFENYKKAGKYKEGSGKGVFDKATGTLRARPFVFPALENNINTILQMIREEVQNAGSK